MVDELPKFVKCEFADEDGVTEKGVTVVIEPKALMHLVGTTMDFQEDALASEFVFHNPNSKGDNVQNSGQNASDLRQPNSALFAKMRKGSFRRFRRVTLIAL